MTSASDETLARLNLLVAGQGDTRLVSQAIAKFGSASKAIASPALRSRLRLGLNEDTRALVERELAAAAAVGSKICEGEKSPIRLDKQQPLLLSIKGEWPTGPAVAIVGSRDADEYGLRVAQTIGGALARAGVAVISGGAHGIDAAAQHAALDAGGSTVAFLGFGIAHRASTVPSELLDRLLSKGTVVSEFLPTARGSKTSYLERNRLIAAIADVVIVVQAREKSGSLNTARHAKRFSKPVYAVPGDVGSPLSEGTNKLIATGHAVLLNHLGTLGRILDRPELRRVGWPACFRSSINQEAGKVDAGSQTSLKAVDRALSAIEKAGGALDRIGLASALELDLPALDDLLVELELEGRLTKDPAGRYIDSRRRSGTIL
jgi:DNA protecting protein DprA